MAKYRVIGGSHSEGVFPPGHPKAGKPRIFRRGMIFETKNMRLDRLYPQKFERVADDIPVTPEEFVELDLDRMKPEELLDYADREGIFVPAAAGPRDVLMLIRQELEKRQHDKKAKVK